MNVRLGSPLPRTWDSAAGWIAAVQRHGFRAAYWPLGDDADAETVDAYAAAAASADVVDAQRPRAARVVVVGVDEHVVDRAGGGG